MWAYSEEVLEGVRKLRAIVNEVQVILNDNKYSIGGLDRDVIISRLENLMKIDPAREDIKQQKEMSG